MKNISELFDGGTKEMQKKKRVTFYAICVTFALLAATLIFLLVTVIVISVGNAKDKSKEDGDEPVNIGTTEIITLDSAQIYSGDLLLLDNEHSFKGKADVILMKSKERPQTDTGTNAYTIGEMEKFSGTKEAIDALNNMIKAFYKSTKNDNIYIANAYNTEKVDTQDAIYASGTAFELKYFSAAADRDWTKKDSIYGASTYNWIYNNAHKYGFIVVNGMGGVNENGEEIGSSVFRYIGIPNATAAKNSKQSFDAYLEALKATTPEAPVSAKVGTARYAIYYLGASAEHKVPTDYEYTVSGNNTDGYIITVDLSAKK